MPDMGYEAIKKVLAQVKKPDIATDTKVGGKTPDEIKKDAELCLHVVDDCNDCEVFSECGGVADHVIKELYDLLVIRYEQRLAQVERERDVLAAALKGVKFCGDCLHLYSKDQGFCLSCSQDRERSKPLWQWRGPCPENTKEGC